MLTLLRTASKQNFKFLYSHSRHNSFSSKSLRCCSLNLQPTAFRNSAQLRILNRPFAKLSTQSITAKRLSYGQYAWHICRRTVLVTYGILATIPTCFTGLAAYYALQPGQEARTKGFLFYAWTGYLTLPLSFVVLISAPFVLAFDREKRQFLVDIQSLWGKLTCWPFFSPRIVGAEHIEQLQSSKQPVIYVSNHQSWLDIYSLLHLDTPILFVSKREVFYIPVVGWVMGLIGHIGVERKNKRSGRDVVSSCKQKLKDGQSVFFFAEGTRSRDGSVQPFKMGAFKIAADAGVPIVPITINGTGELMPPGDETWLALPKDGSCPVEITIHEPVIATDEELVDLHLFRKRVRDTVIASVRTTTHKQ